MESVEKVWPSWISTQQAWEKEVPEHIRELVWEIKNIIMPGQTFRSAKAKEVAEALKEFGVKFRYLSDSYHCSGYTRYYPRLKVVRIFSGALNGYFRRQWYYYYAIEIPATLSEEEVLKAMGILHATFVE